MRRPSAFIPVAMSLAALAVVVVHLITSGTARQADEGTAAHLWQLLMAAQIPIMAFFAIRWLPQPRVALPVLALQVVAAIAALVPVYLLRW
ncbi:MAG: hypothetical protein M3N12_03590 [Verrucomicrobiota bacterium]|nr:hypothetical protein [Verrucomicrobiota bacterium]